MRTAIVIPARFASTRLPGKPLLRETGKYLIEHVFDQARRVRGVDRVLIATDDERIREAVRSFGGEAILTRADHASGTDRIAEVAEQLSDSDLFVNLQGDEPQFDPKAIERLIGLLKSRETYDEAHAATGVTVRQISSLLEEAMRENRVSSDSTADGAAAGEASMPEQARVRAPPAARLVRPQTPVSN